MYSSVHAFEWINEQESPKSGFLRIINQLALPNNLVYVDLRSIEEVAHSIESMQVRGAPAIGIVAAFGLLFAARALSDDPQYSLEKAYRRLAATRPTAVNLFWALERMMRVLQDAPNNKIEDIAFDEAMRIWHEDIAMNLAMAEHGADAIGKISNILTHCNAGALATGGLGTALGVIRCIDARMKHAGSKLHVWVDETRPYLQGARLTAWELMQDKIEATLITDNMAAYFMQQKHVDAVIIGADRIACNGDVANKIGSYALAVCAKYHQIPFYVAAPRSTFDPSAKSMHDIPIEERSAEEVTCIGQYRIAPTNVAVRHPAFDLTPHTLISGIITQDGVHYPPYKF